MHMNKKKILQTAKRKTPLKTLYFENGKIDNTINRQWLDTAEWFILHKKLRFDQHVKTPLHIPDNIHLQRSA